MKTLSCPYQRMFYFYKIFTKPILDYTHVIYDKRLNESIKKKLEMVQYSAALITGAKKIYRKLGLELLAERRWFQNIFLATR